VQATRRPLGPSIRMILWVHSSFPRAWQVWGVTSGHCGHYELKSCNAATVSIDQWPLWTLWAKKVVILQKSAFTFFTFLEFCLLKNLKYPLHSKPILISLNFHHLWYGIDSLLYFLCRQNLGQFFYVKTI
jgi:hypothetical protein